MNKIEVAPNVFLDSWSHVSYGYKHACGAFIIVLLTGKEIQINNPKDVETTVNLWRINALSPLEPVQENISDDIRYWMDQKKQAKQLNYDDG
jgi:hypothetical protein